ncbi:MAG: hypothetical protein ACE148_11240 [Vicinamibacterales bacterium]
MKLSLVAAALAALTSADLAWAQAPPPTQAPPSAQAQPPSASAEGVRIFLDCHARCDSSYIRTELAFVDHVRDREVADVHILVTTEPAGGGGTQYTLNFIGLRRFAGVEDTLKFTTERDDTEDDVRRSLVRSLKLGLVRYLAQTPLASALEVNYRAVGGRRSSLMGQTTEDPWHFWVFRTSMDVQTDGEESSTGVDLSGSFTASRVTEAWKSSLDIDINYRRNSYDLDEEEEGGDRYVSISRNWDATATLVKSLGNHWGTGVRAILSSSTYTNHRRTIEFAPAIEYNVFPYSESTRRQLTFTYSAGLNSYEYRSRTIYGKTEETLASQALAVNLDLQQPWGTMDFQVEASQYVPDFKRNRLSFESDVEVRLFKGFSLDLGADASFIRDQIYLPAGRATPEEILLRQRQIATGYDYGFRMGFSYSFGSVFNNVVNSRLSGF